MTFFRTFVWSMLATKSINSAGSLAVRRLRLRKLQDGHPFMINSRDLPSNQCYLEYPNGSIKLATISGNKREFTILKELSVTESHTIRHKYHLA